MNRENFAPEQGGAGRCEAANFFTRLSVGRVAIRPWGKRVQEVTMDSPKTSSRDDRFAARKVLLDQLARLRDQFSAGWLYMEPSEAFAAPQRATR